MTRTDDIRAGVARAFGLLALLLAVLGGSSCKPDSRVFGGTVTGTVFDLTAQPAGLVTVYVVDPEEGKKAEQVDALSGSNGHFRLDAPAGTWTLVATDFQGAASFLYGVRVGNGQVVDVGALYLAPCAQPGSGSNAEVYEECPDPSADDYGYGTPPADYALSTFEPEYTDANLSDAPAGDDILEVSSYSTPQQVRIDIQVPDSSPYFAVGAHEIPPGAYEQFFATLYELDTGVMYILRSGTFSVEALDPVAGGAFRARLSNAIFDWYDFENGIPDESFSATLGATDPAMTDTITVTAANGESGSPPPQSYTFAQLQPEFTQIYVAADGSATVVTYDTLASGEYVQLILDLPPELNAVGSFPVQNTFGSDSSAWGLELHATALYGDGMGYEYGYILESGTWTVYDAATGPGDAFAASLDQATFQWQADPGAQPFATLTLGIGSSGTMSGTADASDPGAGSGRVDWGSLKTDLTTHLGN